MHKDTIIAYAKETQCQFYSPINFPDMLYVGLRVTHLGERSVRYELAIFKDQAEIACAIGHFVHVFVNRLTNTPTRIPVEIRKALERL